jgi:hypothetical protein
MAQYWLPLGNKPATTAASLVNYRRGVGTENASSKVSSKFMNPTVVPGELLQKFHFAFLIRHPKSSIPSYFRCTIPPLSDMTGFDYFDPKEAGYKELRTLFDFLVKDGQIGPNIAGSGNRTFGAENGSTINGSIAHKNNVEICIVDADNLLDNPYGVIEAFCKSVGLEYSPSMLKWNAPEIQQAAQQAFEKWKGFHEDALESDELRPRTHVRNTNTCVQTLH